ncbi:hypothetical protein BCR33DRAFT_764507 [Rhizoclosmatium globosum]|uniref:Uncharacterized protein n=1 Tax=Rhizoclosmatium globosum TaxID=329046 RepID=A0A1Y2CIW7_9FUNG|nr:hypothetical protein BCR33DRAFT_764507 [Rhizoclosmatium globosum]|eukprot:ORY46784.1 hypothetical protein BCR33DRAFT_764507 [Rhizoclosmatium globosum]
MDVQTNFSLAMAILAFANMAVITAILLRSHKKNETCLIKTIAIPMNFWLFGACISTLFLNSTQIARSLLGSETGAMYLLLLIEICYGITSYCTLSFLNKLLQASKHIVSKQELASLFKWLQKIILIAPFIFVTRGIPPIYGVVDSSSISLCLRALDVCASIGGFLNAFFVGLFSVFFAVQAMEPDNSEIDAFRVIFSFGIFSTILEIGALGLYTFGAAANQRDEIFRTIGDGFRTLILTTIIVMKYKLHLLKLDVMSVAEQEQQMKAAVRESSRRLSIVSTSHCQSSSAPLRKMESTSNESGELSSDSPNFRYNSRRCSISNTSRGPSIAGGSALDGKNESNFSNRGASRCSGTQDSLNMPTLEERDFTPKMREFCNQQRRRSVDVTLLGVSRVKSTNNTVSSRRSDNHDPSKNITAMAPRDLAVIQNQTEFSTYFASPDDNTSQIGGILLNSESKDLKDPDSASVTRKSSIKPTSFAVSPRPTSTRAEFNMSNNNDETHSPESTSQACSPRNSLQKPVWKPSHKNSQSSSNDENENTTDSLRRNQSIKSSPRSLSRPVSQRPASWSNHPGMQMLSNEDK